MNEKELIKEAPYNIKLITKPSEELCMIAVRSNPEVIEYIKNPTEKICIQAIRIDPKVIRFIKYPNERVCLEAVKNDYYGKDAIIQYIENKTYNLCLEAVKKNGYAINFIGMKNWNCELIKEAIRSTYGNILYNWQEEKLFDIDDIGKDSIIKSIEEMGYIIKEIKPENQDFDIVNAFFNSNKKIMLYIINI